MYSTMAQQRSTMVSMVPFPTKVQLRSRVVVMPGPNSLNASLVGAKTVKGPIPDSFMHGTLVTLFQVFLVAWINTKQNLGTITSQPPCQPSRMKFRFASLTAVYLIHIRSASIGKLRKSPVPKQRRLRKPQDRKIRACRQNPCNWSVLRCCG